MEDCSGGFPLYYTASVSTASNMDCSFLFVVQIKWLAVEKDQRIQSDISIQVPKELISIDVVIQPFSIGTFPVSIRNGLKYRNSYLTTLRLIYHIPKLCAGVVGP